MAEPVDPRRGKGKAVSKWSFQILNFFGALGGSRAVTFRSFGKTLSIFNSKYVSHFNQTSSVLFLAKKFAFWLCHGGSYESAKLSNIITIRKLSCISHVNYAEPNTEDRKMFFPLQFFFFLPCRDFRNWLERVFFSRLNLQTKRMSNMPVPWQTRELCLWFLLPCNLQRIDFVSL